VVYRYYNDVVHYPIGFSIYYSFVFSALWLFAKVIVVKEKKFVNSAGSKDTVTFWSVGVENKREPPQNFEMASSKQIFELRRSLKRKHR
jgi:hypothetical protein